jgi:hypothetical protein
LQEIEEETANNKIDLPKREGVGGYSGISENAVTIQRTSIRTEK